MGSIVAWILWTGLLDAWDWVFYLVINGARKELPFLAEQHARTQGLYSSLGA